MFFGMVLQVESMISFIICFFHNIYILHVRTGFYIKYK